MITLGKSLHDSVNLLRLFWQEKFHQEFSQSNVDRQLLELKARNVDTQGLDIERIGAVICRKSAWASFALKLRFYLEAKSLAI